MSTPSLSLNEAVEINYSQSLEAARLLEQQEKKLLPYPITTEDGNRWLNLPANEYQKPQQEYLGITSEKMKELQTIELRYNLTLQREKVSSCSPSSTEIAELFKKAFPPPPNVSKEGLRESTLSSEPRSSSPPPDIFIIISNYNQNKKIVEQEWDRLQKALP